MFLNASLWHSRSNLVFEMYKFFSKSSIPLDKYQTGTDSYALRPSFASMAHLISLSISSYLCSSCISTGPTRFLKYIIGWSPKLFSVC